MSTFWLIVVRFRVTVKKKSKTQNFENLFFLHGGIPGAIFSPILENLEKPIFPVSLGYFPFFLEILEL